MCGSFYFVIEFCSSHYVLSSACLVKDSCSINCLEYTSSPASLKSRRRQRTRGTSILRVRLMHEHTPWTAQHTWGFDTFPYPRTSPTSPAASQCIQLGLFPNDPSTCFTSCSPTQQASRPRFHPTERDKHSRNEGGR